MKGAGKPLSLLKVKFIQAWQNVLARSILKPIGQQPQYRGPTPQRRKSGGQWRNIVGGAKWVSKASSRKHKKWLATEKTYARKAAAFRAEAHARGDSFGPTLSNRAFKRSSGRIINRTIAVD